MAIPKPVPTTKGITETILTHGREKYSKKHPRRLRTNTGGGLYDYTFRIVVPSAFLRGQ